METQFRNENGTPRSRNFTWQKREKERKKAKIIERPETETEPENRERTEP